MNTNLKFIIISFFSAIIIVSCTSHEQDTDNSFELIKQEKSLLGDSAAFSKEIIHDTIKVPQLDDWTLFKTEIEKKIVSNERKIKVLKNMPNTNANLFRKVADLEKDNNDLRRQMDEYNEEVKLKWENFKILMNHNVTEIEIELKDLNVNNK